MHMMWFTERAYHEEDAAKSRALEDEVIRKRSFYNTPNEILRPQGRLRPPQQVPRREGLGRGGDPGI